MWNQLLELESKADQFGPFEVVFKQAVDFVQSCNQSHDLQTIQFVAVRDKRSWMRFNS